MKKYSRIDKFQKMYLDNNIDISSLTIEQLEVIIRLYDEKINKLKKSNEQRKNKLLTYKKKK